MNETEFCEILMNEGYDGPFDFAIESNAADNEHVHDYDVLVMIGLSQVSQAWTASNLHPRKHISEW
jgi:hypothetical protein